MKKWIVTALLLTAFVGTADAKKSKPKNEQPPVPKRNFIDLRGAQFLCSDSVCGLDVSQFGLIACSVNGCALMTDVLVSTGPVQRAQARPPAAPPQ
jgi:hypothetical protein